MIKSSAAILAAALLMVGACVPIQTTTTGGIATGRTLSASPPAYPAFHAGLNALRQDNGRAPVASNARLRDVARAYAERVRAAGTLSHRLDGTTVSSRVAGAGIQTCTVAENLANGYRSAEAALAAWQASGSHRPNLLKQGLTHYGLGQSGDHWVLILARPC